MLLELVLIGNILWCFILLLLLLMKGVSGWRDYWGNRRTRYQRLNERIRRRKRVVEMGGRRYWRIRVGPRIRIPRIPGGAKKMALWLRDAYVRMMMGMANSGLRGMRGADAVVGFGNPPIKEYDRNMILHIYNSLVVAPVHHDPRPHNISALSSS